MFHLFCMMILLPSHVGFYILLATFQLPTYDANILKICQQYEDIHRETNKILFTIWLSGDSTRIYFKIFGTHEIIILSGPANKL